MDQFLGSTLVQVKATGKICPLFTLVVKATAFDIAADTACSSSGLSTGRINSSALAACGPALGSKRRTVTLYRFSMACSFCPSFLGFLYSDADFRFGITPGAAYASR